MSQGSKFPGLLGVVEAYIDTLDVDEGDRLQISRYLDLVRKRATGMDIVSCSFQMCTYIGFRLFTDTRDLDS